MNVSEFRSAAIQSARCYYRYLEENGKGVVRTEVRSIHREGMFFILHLRTKLSPSADPASLLFDFDGRRYTSFEIRPVSLTNARSQLWVRPSDALSNRFSLLRPDEITVLSDLKFLVKNVESWYENYGESIRLSTKKPAASPILLSQADSLSQEQRAAVEGVLSHSLSYVWGAPGTGKTRCVLARCVLSYLLSSPERKVLLLAPTNNAVEQMLFGILPALSRHGVSLDAVLRLGIPSSRFARQYPSVCESAGAADALPLLRERRDYLQKCLAFRQYTASFSAAEEGSLSAVSSIFLLTDRLHQLESAAEALRLESASFRGKLVLAQDEICRLLAAVSKRRNLVSGSLVFRVKKRLFPGAARKEFQLLQEEEDALRKQVAEADRLETSIQEANRSESNLFSQRDSVLSEIESLRSKILNLCAFRPDLHSAVLQADFSDKDACISQFRGIFSRLRRQLSTRGAIYAALDPYDDDAIRRELLDCESRISEADQSDDLSKGGIIRVLAATLDRFISSAAPSGFGSFFPDHIFVDEASYAALIKSAPIFSMDVPVTLMGDHMQLPPVCEIDEAKSKQEDLAPVFLWSQSSLHVESVFFNTFHQMLSRFRHGGPPEFLLTREFDLTATYRFGDSLAHLLASYIYSPLFHSAVGSGTGLYYMDAPGPAGEKTRTRPSEVRAIQEIFPLLDGLDYAILSPYRNQVSLLSSGLRSSGAEERILTVHASQGREWDIVFFSVVDVPEHMWFTDTVSPRAKGKLVVNTALSRARKALVLVCDAARWSTRSDQLIGALCKNACPFSAGVIREIAPAAAENDTGGDFDACR